MSKADDLDSQSNKKDTSATLVVPSGAFSSSSSSSTGSGRLPTCQTMRQKMLASSFMDIGLTEADQPVVVEVDCNCSNQQLR
jgi:hypothetical protein